MKGLGSLISELFLLFLYVNWFSANFQFYFSAEMVHFPLYFTYKILQVLRKIHILINFPIFNDKICQIQKISNECNIQLEEMN